MRENSRLKVMQVKLHTGENAKVHVAYLCRRFFSPSMKFTILLRGGLKNGRCPEFLGMIEAHTEHRMGMFANV